MQYTLILATVLIVLQGCGRIGEHDETLAYQDPWSGKALSPESMLERKKLIRNVARSAGLNNAAPLAGIALAETGLAHCWREATWTCQGPWSDDCSGPVIAGAGDGPCSWQEGGLGMFQFDAGTFQETLQRDGRDILTLAGNIRKAVDFVTTMLINSGYVDLRNRDDALDWLEGIRPGTDAYNTWIKIVTHKYNGCAPGYCDVYWQRFDHYDKFARAAFEDVPENFWRSTPNQPNPVSNIPIEVWWHRGADGIYQLKSLAPTQVASVKYTVDGYSIAENIQRDNPETDAAENNFPAAYRFSTEGLMRNLVVEGFDRFGNLIARGVGSIDITEGTGVYIRQMTSNTYQIGLERAPDDVKTIEVIVDGYTLVDAITGERRSPRLATRSSFNRLGERSFEILGFNESGVAITRNIRTFVLE